MDLRDDVVIQGIANDAAWVSRLVADLADPASNQCAPIVSFCVMPYIALFVHESYAKLKTIHPTLFTTVTADFEAIVARSRHTLKLFEDTHRGIAGQLDYFRDEIRTAHRDRFITSVFRPLRFLANDLGLFTYDSKLITTTQVAAFHFGMAPREFFKTANPELRTFAEQYGRYFRHLGAQVPADSGTTFLSRLNPAIFAERGKDVRSTKYYSRIFDGSANSDLNVVLTVFRCMANFADTAISVTDINGGIDYTEFKIRFLTTYQVLRSLKVLHGDTTRVLTQRSAVYLGKILDTPEARAIMDRTSRPFRNTLMHYNLNPQFNLASVDLNDPLFGLAPHYYPSCNDVRDLAKLVDQTLSHTATALNEWAEP